VIYPANGDFEVDERVSGEHPGSERFPDSLFYGFPYVLREWRYRLFEGEGELLPARQGGDNEVDFGPHGLSGYLA
jgi:hypothetical protein